MHKFFRVLQSNHVWLLRMVYHNLALTAIPFQDLVVHTLLLQRGAAIRTDDDVRGIYFKMQFWIQSWRYS
jgi:hypothetical protein